jgi:hypothetical protein
MRATIPILFALMLLSSNWASAQTTKPGTTDEEKQLDQEVALLRRDVRSQKKQITAANLTLTDSEAEKFWPAYDRYEAEVAKVNDVKYGLIKQYAKNIDSLSDETADKITHQALGLDQSLAQLRMKYLPVFRKILSAKSTARFIQIDRRLANLIDLQVASAIPLVQP